MIRKISAILICLAIVFSFVACNNSVKFIETENKAIVANDGTEYTFVCNEGKVWCFGKREFIGRVAGEKPLFIDFLKIYKTGIYSVNGSQDVLVRYLPNNEFSSIYVKSGLLKAEISLENCIRFEFAKDLLSENTEFSRNIEAITDCEQFLTDIRNGQTAKDAGLYELIKQPDGMLKNCYVYGYLCGVVQEDINLYIPMQISSFDDKAYSITIDAVEYVLPEEWVNKLIVE